MPEVKILRVIVASPGDVKPEREVLPGVIEELNRNLGRDRHLQLDLYRWETDTYPGFHPEGPQGLIDPILDIRNCDILIGIFWKRFGTPTMEAKSGTEHEFLTAYEAWKEKKSPQIMVYFNQQPYSPQNEAELDQWGQVLKFRGMFPKEGLWWPYTGVEEFKDLARNHLTQVIRGFQLHTSVQQPPGITQNPAILSQQQIKNLREAYLNWLMEQVRAIPLSGVDRKSIREETRRDLELAAVYTALMTEHKEGQDKHEHHFERETKALSALTVLNTKPRLALLGDPGSGKSTFVNFVAMCMAGEILACDDANLKILQTPIPADDESNEEKSGQPQPWDHGALLPVRVVLREFVARGLPAAGESIVINSDTLWNFIVTELPEQTLRDYAKPLREELQGIGGLLLLDGLDEVPEAEHRREQVKQAIEEFAKVFPKVRILATSRTYAYQKQDWKLRNFAETVLAPFDFPQINRFVERWYAYVAPLRKLSETDAQGRAELLKREIQRNPRLFELASRPLLLTLMASLHAWRGGNLPDDREELYADAVDLLLDEWEGQKVKRKPDGSDHVIQESLAEVLKVDKDKKAIRQVLNRIAFDVHHCQPVLTGTADIAQSSLVNALLALNPDVKPARLIEYLRDRAGLIEPHGVGIYRFPHRTFQEYLAACHLTDNGFPDELAELLFAEPNRWREVTLLAGAKAARGAAVASWLLAEALCFEDAPKQKLDEEKGYWGALLAAQVLIENKSLSNISPRNQPKVERIRQWLRCTLQHGVLSPVDRAESGNALALIGDPRFRADAWHLPDEPLLGFVEVPAGPFQMGSNDYEREHPPHECNIPGYYIARYPVTVAQYRAYMRDNGHLPDEADRIRGLPNHPVVGITWHEALKYCDWLTKTLRHWAELPEPLAVLLQQGWKISLPSEAEWEKAARGDDARVFPWGNEDDPGKANYNETGINTTSAIGCFPGGASPYGCLDMAGNVWEWTRSLWGKDWDKPKFKYPYTLNDNRENLKADNEMLRLLRGGAFLYYRDFVCCAYRVRPSPNLRNHVVGFRVVLHP